MYWAALLYGLNAVLILSCTAISIPTAHPAARKDLSGTRFGEPDSLSKRTIHLTARPNWKFQTGVWSVNFLKIALFPVAQANLVELYHDVMALTEPFAHQTPQGRYFQYNFGQLALIFESQDSRYIPWKVIYDFAQQAIDRADRGLIGLYSGVSPTSRFFTPERRAFLVPNTPGTQTVLLHSQARSLACRCYSADSERWQYLLSAAGQQVAFRLIVRPRRPTAPLGGASNHVG